MYTVILEKLSCCARSKITMFNCVSNSRGDGCKPNRHDLLRQLSENVKISYNIYRKEDNTAEAEGLAFDGPVYVSVPVQLEEDDWFSAEELGAVSRNVGPGLRIDAYATSRKLELHSLARSYRHAGICVEVNDMVSSVTRNFRRGVRPSICHSSGGTFGVSFISAPDVLLRSIADDNGKELKDSAEAPIFVCEVEDNNRSLPALIRHCGALLVNYPNLNGVVGIKSGRSKDGAWVVLFVIEAIGGDHSLTVMLDFGPQALTETIAQDALDTFTLPLPPLGTQPRMGQQGAGIVNIPEWVRLPNGIDPTTGNPYIHEIPLALMLTGAHDTMGDTLQVPPGSGAQLDLAELLRQYGI